MRNNQKHNLGLKRSQRKELEYFVTCVPFRKPASWETFSYIISVEKLYSQLQIHSKFQDSKSKIVFLQHFFCLLLFLKECTPDFGGSMHKTGIILKTWEILKILISLVHSQLLSCLTLFQCFPLCLPLILCSKWSGAGALLYFIFMLLNTMKSVFVITGQFSLLW